MIQKKKILFFARLYHPHIGGVEKHVEELSHLLVEKGCEVTIITERFNHKLALKETMRGVVVYRIPITKEGPLKKFFIWKWMVSNLKIIGESDIVHIHDVFYWYLPFRFLFPLKPVYMTFHGYEGYPIKKSWKWQRKMAEILTKGNICVGDFMKKWYKTKPTSVIYGGVRLKGKNQAVTSRSGVFFGRFDEQTGIREYLKAYSIIKKKIPDFSLTLVGDGKLQIKIPAGIRVFGFKKDVFPFIKEHRILFVSRYLSMLEGLASGKEIVATYDNPVKRDYLYMSPFKKYIKIAKNHKEIARFVVDSLTNGKDSTAQGEGVSWARQQTWEKVTDVYLKLWGY